MSSDSGGQPLRDIQTLPHPFIDVLRQECGRLLTVQVTEIARS